MLCAACETEEIVPTEVETTEDALGLSVSASDFEPVDPIAATATRATDNGVNITFDEGDRVGLIVLDGKSDIVIDNAPYKYDGTKWTFDADNTDGKRAPGYDPSMRKYIVYYPYDASANGATTVEELKKLDVFRIPIDQSTEAAYRQADLMAWETDGAAMKQINAKLTHARASFTLAPTLQWTISTGEKISCVYADEIFIYDNDGTFLSPYVADDGSFRYILPDSYNGYIRWHYTYKEQTYSGRMENLSGTDANTRYVQQKLIDEGEFTTPAVGDYYCVREVDGKNEGYIVPVDAAPYVKQNKCIGIVFKLGAEDSDEPSDYDGKLTDNKIHGYVVALQDAYDGICAWGRHGTKVGTSVCSATQYDFKGYYNTKLLRAKNPTTDTWPAAYYIGEYYKQIPAPVGTSGWYFPSSGQLKAIYDALNAVSGNFAVAGGTWMGSSTWEEGTIRGIYLSSSEYNRGYIEYNVGSFDFRTGQLGWKEKDGKDGADEAFVRAVLTF